MKTFLTLFITFFIYCQTSFSQSIYDDVVNFLSLEGKEVSVKYGYDPKFDRTMLELNPNEKLCIQDTRGVISAKISQKKFVELTLPMPGGSGESVHKVVIICVSNGKLYESINVTSLVKNTITGVSDFEVNFTGPIEKNGSFELNVGESILHFDSDKKIFFDGYYTLNGIYYVSTDKDPQKKEKVFQNERYPTVFNEYIFIKKNWYIFNNNNLRELTSTCD
jgi:hypothetical protein